MKLIRAFFRLISVSLTLFIFAVISTILFPFLVAFPFARRKVATELNVITCKLMLKALGFNVQHKGPQPKEGSIIVGNHMSYLDILIYQSRFKCLFVTSVDMGRRPVLGQLTWLGGCLFVDRKNPRNLHNELKTLKKYFDKGFMVCFFPEGTSSDGKSILPFKKSLFQLALDVNAPVQPIALNYLTVNGQDFGDENRDDVCWHGDIKFVDHFVNLVQLDDVQAQLQVLSPIDSSKYSDRKTLAEDSRNLILEQYTKNLSP